MSNRLGMRKMLATYIAIEDGRRVLNSAGKALPKMTQKRLQPFVPRNGYVLGTNASITFKS